MVIPIGPIIAATGVLAATATSIANTINQYDNGGSSRSSERASLVVSLARDIHHKLDYAGKGDLSAVIFRGDLKKDLFYRRGGYLGKITLGGYGYSIYAVASGHLKNNDSKSRGFHNWCVVGHFKQHNNYIEIY